MGEIGAGLLEFSIRFLWIHKKSFLTFLRTRFLGFFFSSSSRVFPHTSWKVFMASPTENVLYFLLLHHHHHYFHHHHHFHRHHHHHFNYHHQHYHHHHYYYLHYHHHHHIIIITIIFITIIIMKMPPCPASCERISENAGFFLVFLNGVFG